MKKNIDKDFDEICKKDIRNSISVAFNNIAQELSDLGFSDNEIERWLNTKGSQAKMLLCGYINEEIKKHITSIKDSKEIAAFVRDLQKRQDVNNQLSAEQFGDEIAKKIKETFSRRGGEKCLFPEKK